MQRMGTNQVGKNKRIGCIALTTGLSIMMLGCSSSNDVSALPLAYIGSEKIADKSIGLQEPSGLAYSVATDTLWTVSDDTAAVFRFRPDGKGKVETLSVKEKDLEGITLAELDGYFFTLNEAKGQITRFSLDKGKPISHHKISEMKGYDEIRKLVKKAGKQHGFEGLAWHPTRRTLFALLEGPPGALLEISADLKTILSATELTKQRGFIAPDKDVKKIDFSGIAVDKDRVWIISDQAAGLFVYDLSAEKVTHATSLTSVNKKGKHKPIEKAEGIALNHDASELFIVSDSAAKLYRWKVQAW